MKASSVLFMLVITTICASAQTPPPKHGSSDIAILKFNWHKNFHRADWDRQGTASRLTRGVLVRQQADFIREYVYKVTIQNNSSKRVAAIDWDYVFIDPTTHMEVARHAFRSTELIYPGKKKSLIGSSIKPQTGVISVTATRENPHHPFDEKVVICSILYAQESSHEQKSFSGK
jgi:hypothetical protein